MGRKLKQLLLLTLLPLVLVSSGCPKDPYRVAIRGSDEVSEGVHQAVDKIGKLYSQGVADDAYKAAAANYLDLITNCNMSFRKGVVDVHRAGLGGVSAFLPIANSFVSCAQQSMPPQGPAQSALKAVDTAIRGITLAISNAKGGNGGS